MQRKLMGIISVNFDTTGQLLIMYSVFKYLKKNKNKILENIVGTYVYYYYYY